MREHLSDSAFIRTGIDWATPMRALLVLSLHACTTDPSPTAVESSTDSDLGRTTDDATSGASNAAGPVQSASGGDTANTADGASNTADGARDAGGATTVDDATAHTDVNSDACNPECGPGTRCEAGQCVSVGNDPCDTDPNACQCGGLEQACCSDASCGGGLVCGGARCGCAVACSLRIVLTSDGELWNDTQPILMQGGSSLRVKAFALGDYAAFQVFMCLIEVNGGVYCFGRNEHGLGGGDPAQVEANQLVTVVDTAGAPIEATDISMRGYSACAVVKGEVFCWGQSNSGHLGADAGENTHAATRVPADASGMPLSDVVGVSVSHEDTCALKTDGSVWCWGDNTYGQLAVPLSTQALAYPTRLTALPAAATSLSVGLATEINPPITRCASLQDGSVWCWGYNTTEGSLGGLDPEAANSKMPAPVRVLTADGVPLTDVVKVVPWSSPGETCAFKRDSTLWCWGSPERPNRARQFLAGTMNRPLFAVGSACWIDENAKPMNPDGTFAPQPVCMYKLE